MTRFWQELDLFHHQKTKVPMCSGVLCSPLAPGKSAVWHTPIIGKTQFTAEPIDPTGQHVSGW